MSDSITISINDQNYSGWTEVSVKQSIETLTGSFVFKVTDKTNQKTNSEWPIIKGDKAIVKVNDIPLINGYVFKVTPKISAEEHSISISGRDKTADLVDSSADLGGKKFSLKKTNIKKLAEILTKPYGIGVKVEPGTDVLEVFDISFNTSESPFEVLDEKAKELGILLISDSSGRLVLTNSGSSIASDSLVYGENILGGSATYDDTNLFSEYIIFGQSKNSDNWGENISVRKSAKDPNVPRFRPLIIQSEGETNGARAQKRANWEANVRAAKSKTVQIKVRGFLQEDGLPWKINEIVSVLAPPLYINPATQLLITSLDFTINNSGSFTNLNLMRKDAFERFPKKTVKRENSLGWN